jgi:hypothetical protein
MRSHARYFDPSRHYGAGIEKREAGGVTATPRLGLIHVARHSAFSSASESKESIAPRQLRVMASLGPSVMARSGSTSLLVDVVLDVA